MGPRGTWEVQFSAQKGVSGSRLDGGRATWPLDCEAGGPRVLPEKE